MENRKSNTGLTYGLIGGLALSVFLLVLYLVGTSAFMSPAAWIGYIVIIAIAVLAGVRQRKLNGGYIEFGEALKVVFAVFALSFLIQTVFSYILLNYIDVPFRDALTQATMDKTEEFMRRMGMPDSEIDKALTEASKQDPSSIKNTLLGYGISLIVFFIISLIIAAIIKRKQPVFDNSFNQP
jgi:hypothetical protein